MSMITHPAHIALFRLLAIRQKLYLETKGLKGRQSMYALIKKEFGLKGTKAKVYDDFCFYIESVQTGHASIIGSDGKHYFMEQTK